MAADWASCRVFRAEQRSWFRRVTPLAHRSSSCRPPLHKTHTHTHSRTLIHTVTGHSILSLYTCTRFPPAKSRIMHIGDFYSIIILIL